MTLLATLYPNYEDCDFDLEAASEAPKRLVASREEAIKWAETEMAEGRGLKLKWEREASDSTDDFWVLWATECNEYGAPEEWYLVVQNIVPYP